jgi:Lon protease-like protein
MMELPLFPLHTVLCPGVALPLHVFEDRYKAMVQRCLADRSPFGVVLIREGREVGPGDLAVAGVGTVAEIREATRYPDGRYDLVTLGTQRFRLESVDPEAEPYLVGQITPLGEVLGEAAHAKLLGERVVQLFIRYLELLQVEERAGDRRGPKAPEGSRALLAESEVPEAPGKPWAFDADDLADADADLCEDAERRQADADGLDAAVVAGAGGDPTGDAPPSAELPGAGEDPADPADDPTGAGSDAADDSDDAARAAMLDDAARRLTIPDDPTVLSYLLSGIVQIESIRRQGLLEMPTTELRLVELTHLLEREMALLERGLATYAPDPRLAAMRRN